MSDQGSLFGPTLAEATDEFMGELNWKTFTPCGCCGHRVILWHKRTISGTSCAFLNELAYRTDREIGGWVHVRQIKDLKYEDRKLTQGDHSKLRHWGLVVMAEDNPSFPHKTFEGYYKITPNGLLFLRGELEIHKYASYEWDRECGKLKFSYVWGPLVDLEACAKSVFDYGRTRGWYGCDDDEAADK